MSGKGVPVARCSFCGKAEGQVAKMIAGPSGLFICNECVDLCKEIIDEEDIYDDEPSGDMDIKLMKPKEIKAVSGDKKVVLGLITTKSPKLEDKQAVIARIHEAAKYVPLDRLYLSPQCGFASCEIGNKLTEKQQWAKLALVKEIAEEVWGK